MKKYKQCQVCGEHYTAKLEHLSIKFFKKCVSHITQKQVIKILRLI